MKTNKREYNHWDSGSSFSMSKAIVILCTIIGGAYIYSSISLFDRLQNSVNDRNKTEKRVYTRADVTDEVNRIEIMRSNSEQGTPSPAYKTEAEQELERRKVMEAETDALNARIKSTQNSNHIRVKRG